MYIHKKELGFMFYVNKMETIVLSRGLYVLEHVNDFIQHEDFCFDCEAVWFGYWVAGRWNVWERFTIQYSKTAFCPFAGNFYPLSNYSPAQ